MPFVGMVYIGFVFKYCSSFVDISDLFWNLKSMKTGIW